MSKIVRANADVKAFASNATGTERTIFGEVTQSDLLTAQLTTDFLRGFGIVGANENPTREDFNALGFTSTQFIAYLHQMGVAEWNALQQYQIGSQANRAGVLYACKTVDHISATAPESDATNWRQVNLGVSGDGGNLTQTLEQTQAAISSEIASTVPATYTASDSQILDNGLIMQFGSFFTGAITNQATGTQNFPVAFPTSCLQVIVGSTTGKASGNVSIEGFSATSFTPTNFDWASSWESRDDTNGSITYIAVGY